MATPNPASLPYATNTNNNNNNNNSNQYQSQPFDTTGQVQPHGLVPKCSVTLWEDEATLCYQIEIDGICVAMRDGELQSFDSQSYEQLVDKFRLSRQPHYQRHEAPERYRDDQGKKRWYPKK